MTAPGIGLELVRLRTGEEVRRAMVVNTVASLMTLKGGPAVGVFVQMVEACRNPEHCLFGEGSWRELERYGLIRRYDPETRQVTIDDETRAIVLAAAEGDGGDMRIVNPFAS